MCEARCVKHISVYINVYKYIVYIFFTLFCLGCNRSCTVGAISIQYRFYNILHTWKGNFYKKQDDRAFIHMQIPIRRVKYKSTLSSILMSLFSRKVSLQITNYILFLSIYSVNCLTKSISLFAKCFSWYLVQNIRTPSLNVILWSNLIKQVVCRYDNYISFQGCNIESSK